MLTPAFFPEILRGTERAVYELSRGLARHGHEVTVVTSHPGRFHDSTDDGVRIIRLPRPPAGRLDRRAFEWHLTHVPFAYAALRRLRPDVAHAWFTTDAIAAARWRRVTGRPAVHSYMGIPDHAGLMDRRRRLDITLQAVAGTDATVTLSEYSSREFQRWLAVEAEVIPPPVDTERFTFGVDRADVPTVVCAADAKVPRKRVGMLISAFARVRDVHPNARLILQHRSAADLADPGRGVEAVDMSDLAAVYQSAWVCALPSFGEAYGMVLAEAMACGVPAVGTDAGGIPEVIEPGTGILFRGGEAELAQALIDGLELARVPATAKRCRDRALKLSIDSVVDAYLQLYERLIGQASASRRST